MHQHNIKRVLKMNSMTRLEMTIDFVPHHDKIIFLGDFKLEIGLENP